MMDTHELAVLKLFIVGILGEYRDINIFFVSFVCCVNHRTCDHRCANAHIQLQVAHHLDI